MLRELGVGLLEEGMIDETKYRTVGFIRPTPATAAAFAQVDELRARLAAATDAQQRVELRAGIGKLTQEIRKIHQAAPGGNLHGKSF